MEHLKFETEWLDKATMVRELRDLDCMVCPSFKIKGGVRGVEFRCNHPALCVPVRFKGQLGAVPRWCPRKKAIAKLKTMRDRIV